VESSKVAAASVGIVLVITLAGFAFYYIETSANIKTMSSSISSQQQTINNLNAQIASIQQHTVTVTQTLTQTSYVTSTSTTSIYPVPTNVTVLFTKVDGSYNHEVDAGTSVTSGSISGPLTLRLSNLFQGETIKITAETTGIGGCRSGETVTVELFVNGQMATQSTTFCGASSAQIAYTV